MVAIGVGGADAVDVMVGQPFNVRFPKLIGVHLTGALNGWSSAKDIILKVAEELTVKGGTGAIVEYFGPGATSLSATGKGTICNMGAEIGATCSVFGYDANMHDYLVKTGRQSIADAADAVQVDLTADPEVAERPHDFFDRVIEIDLNTLVPYINGPHSPDYARPVSEVGRVAKEEGWPLEISSSLIGSCTNSSYEDITRAASIARQAAAHGIKAATQLMVTPGSQRVHDTIVRDGLLGDFEAIGATVLANACGPCIGQWARPDMPDGTKNVIVNSYNRNFPKRNDGNPNTLSFVTSPDTVVALALAGTLDFNPVTDTLTGADGEPFMLEAPAGEQYPDQGFEPGADRFIAPPIDGSALTVTIDPNSDRLQELAPFAPWNGSDFLNLPVLLKAQGKCTTDHISMAGPWLKYRGHLENISGNLFAGAVNAFTGVAGEGKDPLDGVTKSYPDIAKHLHEAGVQWIAIGDENYGEGSSREHAAMEPRFRGAVAILVRSFARIHEANLKKQGVLALTFADPATYDAIGQDDKINIIGLGQLAPNTPVHCQIVRPTGETIDFEANQTLNEEQIAWFKAGSALNIIRAHAGN